MTMMWAAWHRSTKSDHEDDTSGDTLALLSRVGESRSHEAIASRAVGSAATTVLRHKRMSFKAAGQATLGFLSARRRLEDGLKCFSKRRQSRRDSLSCGDSTFRLKIHLARSSSVWRKQKSKGVSRALNSTELSGTQLNQLGALITPSTQRNPTQLNWTELNSTGSENVQNRYCTMCNFCWISNNRSGVASVSTDIFQTVAIR